MNRDPFEAWDAGKDPHAEAVWTKIWNEEIQPAIPFGGTDDEYKRAKDTYVRKVARMNKKEIGVRFGALNWKLGANNALAEEGWKHRVRETRDAVSRLLESGG